jgi:MoxR-like ATPase
MRHRIGLTYEAEAENITVDNVIGQIMAIVQVP